MRWLALALMLAACAEPPTNQSAQGLSQAQRARIATMAQNWPAAPASLQQAFAALDPYSQSGAPARTALFDPADKFQGLPRAAGHEEVYYTCSACHSLRIVMQQRASRERWDYMLRWMTEKQGMPEPEPETLALLLDYLSANFGTEL